MGEQEIQLAPKEFDLLWELLDHRAWCSRGTSCSSVWGYTFAGDTRTVDVHVRQLRRKLGDASPIVTVWGGVQGVADQGRRVRGRTLKAACFGHSAFDFRSSSSQASLSRG